MSRKVSWKNCWKMLKRKSVFILHSILLEIRDHLNIFLYTFCYSNVPDVPAVTGANDTQDFQAGWMEFSFESAARSKKVDKSAKSYAASMSFSASGVGWGVSGNVVYHTLL